jgi:hypothetical protein
VSEYVAATDPPPPEELLLALGVEVVLGVVVVVEVEEPLSPRIELMKSSSDPVGAAVGVSRAMRSAVICSGSGT